MKPRATAFLRLLGPALSLASLFSLYFSAPRDLSAALVLLAYLSFCLATLQRQRARQAMSQPPALQQLQQTVIVAYASQTGYAEQLARLTVQQLQQAGMHVQLLPLASLRAELLQQARRILFIVSTSGEGDAPDSAAGFSRQLLSRPLALPGLEYALLALGDRHYRQFCAFGHRLQHWLHQQQARSLFDLIEVDNADAGALRHWQHHLGLLSGHTELADWAAPAYQPWILAERRLLNPGSCGAPVYRLALTPPPDSRWQAGDIAEIGPGYPPDAAPATVTAARPPLPHREYSIATLPADGRLELLVRQMRRPDGSLGLGSGWLTAYAEPGQPVALRIRENRNFHTPPAPQRLILIANGTGLAGLRAHLKARAAAGQHGHWLIFGERQQAHDYYYREEIEAWQASGLLQRLDLCFSRDQPQRRYVQHALQENAGELQAWLGQGAAILVCGSLQGMAQDVHATLEQLLGAGQLEQLGESGRYLRDVY